jgi:hypothetical protein
VLIGPNFSARADTGLTLQDGNPGLYFFGSAVFPI